MAAKNKTARSEKTATTAHMPPPPANCSGQLYTIQAADTLFLIAKRFGLTVAQLQEANPQITNSNIINVGQVICIPTGNAERFQVLSLAILSETGQPLPVIDNAVQLNARVILRGTFTAPVQRAFFFLEPTGTEACENATLIGIDCPSATQGVAEIIWQVPAGTLGRVFVVACVNSICAKSEEILVVRNNDMS